MLMQNNIAVVTGAAHGIGRAISRMLHSQGAEVVMMDRDGVGLAEAIDEIGGGGRLHPVEADLRDAATVQRIFAELQARFGRVDALVNNVGQGARERASSFQASEPESWEFLIDICLMTTIRCTHQVIGGMIERKAGKIVNISSDSSFIGAKASAAYAAAKGGVNSFTRSLSREVAAQGITVNAVAPGYIRTRAQDALPPEMVERARAGNTDPRADYELADASTWAPSDPIDLIVSNAMFQWIPGHLGVIERLCAHVAPGGSFALQVPHNLDGHSHRLLRELAAREPYAQHVDDRQLLRSTDGPEPYLELFAGLGWHADVWETTYLHVLAGDDPVFDWISGTGARPVLQALPDGLRGTFESEYRAVLREAYPKRPWGTVLPFPRVFAVARRP